MEKNRKVFQVHVYYMFNLVLYNFCIKMFNSRCVVQHLSLPSKERIRCMWRSTVLPVATPPGMLGQNHHGNNTTTRLESCLVLSDRALYHCRLRYVSRWRNTVEPVLKDHPPVLKDHPIGHKNMVSQDRFSFMTDSITLKCITFCLEYVVLQDRWSVIVAVSQDRFHYRHLHELQQSSN